AAITGWRFPTAALNAPSNCRTTSNGRTSPRNFPRGCCSFGYAERPHDEPRIPKPRYSEPRNAEPRNDLVAARPAAQEHGALAVDVLAAGGGPAPYARRGRGRPRHRGQGPRRR